MTGRGIVRVIVLVIVLGIGACGGDDAEVSSDASAECVDFCSCLVASCGSQSGECLEGCGALDDDELSCRDSMCSVAGDEESIQCMSARGETTCPVTGGR